MKNRSLYILIISILFVGACESIVDVRVNEEDPYLVVDGWLTHEPGDQVIRLTTTQTFYDNTFAPGVTGASVRVIDGSGTVYDFVDQDNGDYVLTSADTFGTVGQSYALEIVWEGNTYTAGTTLPRVPSIDSIRYTYEEASDFGPAYYYSEFFGRDPVGEGDAYWLKAWRNGKFLNQPDEIYLFYDASFSEGNGDGIPFIFPIRISANPFEFDINNNQIPPFLLGDTIQGNNGQFTLNDSKVEIVEGELRIINEDKRAPGGVDSYALDGAPYFQIDENRIGKNTDSLYLELHAISPGAWFFLLRLQQETNRPGGFGALFATPPANLPTNIICDDGSVPVAGFFNVANVSSAGQLLEEDAITEEE